MRELEQAVKRIILTGHYQGSKAIEKQDESGDSLTQGFTDGTMNAESLLASYCSLLYKRFGTYEEVSRRTQLDRRTVKKYVQMGTG